VKDNTTNVKHAITWTRKAWNSVTPSKGGQEEDAAGETNHVRELQRIIGDYAAIAGVAPSDLCPAEDYVNIPEEQWTEAPREEDERLPDPGPSGASETHDEVQVLDEEP